MCASAAKPRPDKGSDYVTMNNHMFNKDSSADTLDYMYISADMLRHWSFAVFLLTVPIVVEPKPTDTISRQRRSVSHAQMMHDRSRSLQERKRRLWIQELLEQVHTAQMWDSPNHSQQSFQNVPWTVIHPPRYPSSTKMSFHLETARMREDLTQETSKRLRSEDSVGKRKRKFCLERWKDLDKRHRGCAV